jgi:hypothetical protein
MLVRRAGKHLQGHVRGPMSQAATPRPQKRPATDGAIPPILDHDRAKTPNNPVISLKVQWCAPCATG